MELFKFLSALKCKTNFIYTLYLLKTPRDKKIWDNRKISTTETYGFSQTPG